MLKERMLEVNALMKSAIEEFDPIDRTKLSRQSYSFKHHSLVSVLGLLFHLLDEDYGKCVV